ncbi:MAG: hypothetical protein KDC66_17735 [Phaeodactylibacter sp.]|nr:hypothetical protein [Phaeodactylibacter sp.]
MQHLLSKIQKFSLLGCLLLLSAGLMAQANTQLQGEQSKKNKGEEPVGPNFQRVELFSPGWTPATKDYSSEVTAGAVFNFDSQKAAAFLQRNPSHFTLVLPTGDDGRTLTLKMSRSNIFTPDFQVYTSDNGKTRYDYKGGLHYHGYVEGEEHSLAAISVFDNEAMGLISTDEGNYNLGRIGNSGQAHILYLDRKMINPPPFDCSTEDDGFGYRPEQLNFSQRNVGDCTKIYIEGGQSLFNNLGSVASVTNLLTGVFNQSAILYANEGLTVAISEIFVWTTPDPYSGPSAGEYRAQFQANTGAFNGDLGHLVELDNVGGQAAGFSGICNANTDESLCFSGFSGTGFSNVPTFSFNVQIFTHELGHLFGSRHTHACVWNGNNTAIDGCAGFTEGGCTLPGNPAGGGTIMSYCNGTGVGINFTLGFGPQPGNVIRNTIANATCLSVSCTGVDNDLCANADPLVCGGPTLAGNMGLATANDAPGGCGEGGNGSDPGVWFSFTGNGQWTTVSTSGSNFDTQINIFQGNCGSLTCIGGNDDVSVGNVTSQFSFCAEAGVPYKVYLDGFGGSIGYYQISISCAATVAPVAPWTSSNVGVGGASYSSTPCTTPPTYSISTSAINNGLGTDNMGFIWQTLCGDFEMAVQVTAVTPNGFAGLMARESTGAGSKMVGLYTNRNNTVRWEARTATNASKSVNFFSKPLPYWVKLVRQGNWFYGYYSYNGVSYFPVSAQQVSMNACIAVGMAAYANYPGGPAVASFSGLSIVDGVAPLAVLPSNSVDPALVGRDISLFPNPAKDMVMLEFASTRTSELLLGEEAYSNQKVGGTVRLRNELGQLIESRQLDSDTERLEWNVSNLNPGLYFFDIQIEGQAPQMLRFVKAK